MIEQTSLPQRTSSMRPIYLLINFVLGLVLWFGLCSDYSWDNVWVYVLFPPIVGLIGLASLFHNKQSLTRQQERVQSLLWLPSIIGGIPYVLWMILAIIPPFVFGPMLWIHQQSSATRIQQVESPSGSQIAEVYYLPDVVLSEVPGRIEVHLKYKWLPFVKRDIFDLWLTEVDENTQNYLSWVDNETLYIKETEQELKLHWMEWEVPAFIH